MGESLNTKTNEPVEEDFYQLLFGVRRSIRYHNRRRLFFDRLNKISKFLAAVSGTATFASVLAEAGPAWTLSFAALVAAFSAVDLVINTSEAARLHSELARQYFELEREMIKCESPIREDIVEFKSRRLEIEANEPPVLKVLDAICHNELLRALGHDDSLYVGIKWYQRIFAHFFDICEHKLQTASRQR